MIVVIDCHLSVTSYSPRTIYSADYIMISFYYALAYKAAIPKSTLLNIIHGTNPTIETIQKICGGFDISLGTFFNTDYFYEIYDDE